MSHKYEGVLRSKLLYEDCPMPVPYDGDGFSLERIESSDMSVHPLSRIILKSSLPIFKATAFSRVAYQISILYTHRRPRYLANILNKPHPL